MTRSTDSTSRRAPLWLAPVLFLLLLGWLSAGSDAPWCLDNGQRRLAATAPSLAEVCDLSAVVNAGAPLDSARLRETFPLVEPFVQWRDGRPLSVFPPATSAVLWLASRAGGPRAGVALWLLLGGLALGGALLANLRAEDGLDAATRRWTALAALAASPALFYLGTVWETLPLAAGLLLLLRERRRPLPEAVSVVYGLLPWLRPEAWLLWAGGLLLLRGARRRLLSVLGLLAGLALQLWLTGSPWSLQLSANYADFAWKPLQALRTLLLLPGGWPWLAASLAAVAALAVGLRREDRRFEGVAWGLWALLALVFGLWQARLDGALRPDWGLALTAPLALAGLLAWRPRRDWSRRGPETALLLAFVAAVCLATPVSGGFHWGPRLLVPALLPLGLGFLLDARRERRLWLAPLLLALVVQAAGVGLLQARRGLVRAQDAALADAASVVLTSELSLVGDHPGLAAGRLVLLPHGEQPVQRALLALRKAGRREFDLVASEGHPLVQYLSRVLGLPAGEVRPLPGGRLGRPLQLQRFELAPPPGSRRAPRREIPDPPPGFQHP